MKRVINKDDVKKIMEFLKKNLDYAILLNKEEANWLKDFFVNQMDWSEFNKTIIHIDSLDKDEIYFTVKKDSDTLDDFIITDNLISMHRTLTLEDILRKLGPKLKFPLEIKFLDSVECFEKKLRKLPYTELLRGEESINKEEEENMLKILEIYKGKKHNEIMTEYKEKIQKIKVEDNIQIIVEEMENQIRAIADKEDFNFSIEHNIYTKETKEKIEKIEIEKDEKLDKLYRKIDEISALLELAPNYEEIIKILRDYEIVDKKKNIIL